MSALALAPFFISPEDYLAGERISPIKHEYRRGTVYAIELTVGGHRNTCAPYLTT